MNDVIKTTTRKQADATTTVYSTSSAVCVHMNKPKNSLQSSSLPMELERKSSSSSMKVSTEAATTSSTTEVNDENGSEMRNLVKNKKVESWTKIADSIKKDPSSFDLFLKTPDGSYSNILSKLVMGRNVDPKTRLWLFEQSLAKIPELATVKHLNSLPIHHAVRNLGRMDCQTKYAILNMLVEAYPQGLVGKVYLSCYELDSKHFAFI